MTAPRCPPFRTYVAAMAAGFPEFHVALHGARSGAGCQVGVYKLIDFQDGLTRRKAERWGREAVERYKELVGAGNCSAAEL